MSAILPPETGTISVYQPDQDWDRLYTTWLLSLRSDNTRRNYASAWTRFLAFVTAAGSEPLSPEQVKPEHVIAWRSALVREFNENTVNLSLSALSSFYRFLKKHYPQIAPDNPCTNVDRMKVDPYGRATFLDTSPEKAEDFRLLESLAADDSYAGARDFAIVLTLLTTALRVSALVNAKRRDLTAEGAGGKLTYKVKGNRTDDMTIRPHTYAALTAYLSRRWNEDGYVKLSDPLFLYEGKPITSTHIQRIIRRRCDVVFGKGHNITPHSLRHTAAVITSDEGSFSEVFALLRHSSARVTSIYLQHIDKKRAGAKAGARLDDRYSGA